MACSQTCPQQDFVGPEFQNNCGREAGAGANQCQTGKVTGAKERDDKEGRKENQCRAKVADQSETAADETGIQNEEDQIPFCNDPVHCRSSDKDEANFHNLGGLE